MGKPSNGWYCHIDRDTGELLQPKVREKETLKGEFWKPVFEKTDFAEYLKNKFSVGHRSMLAEAEVEEIVDDHGE